MSIIGYIIVAITILCLIIISYAIVHSNHVKCPYCGEDMNYIGSDETFSQNSDKPSDFLMQHHYYKCLHCGKIIII